MNAQEAIGNAVRIMERIGGSNEGMVARAKVAEAWVRIAEFYERREK